MTTNPPQDQTRFPSPVTAREILSPSLTGSPPTVSMVRYTAVRDSGVSEVLRAFPACVSIGRIFFALPPDKLGAAANKETVFKGNLDEESWHRCGQFLHCVPFLCFLSFIIFPK